MKLTEQQLKQLIKEELESVITEGWNPFASVTNTAQPMPLLDDPTGIQALIDDAYKHHEKDPYSESHKPRLELALYKMEDWQKVQSDLDFSKWEKQIIDLFNKIKLRQYYRDLNK